MRSIQTKITLTYILLATAVIIAVGVVSSVSIESYFRARSISELSSQAEVVLTALDALPSADPGKVSQLVKRLSDKGGFRITLIAEDGRVLEDSDVAGSELDRVENHLHRPEVQEALRKGVGVDTRRSATVGHDFLYVAKRVDPPVTAQSLGMLKFVRLSMHLEDFQKMIAEIRFSITLAGFLVLLIVFGVSVFVSRRITSPIVRIANSVAEIRAGNLDTRIDSSANDEIGQLAQAVNELVEKLKDDIVQLKKLQEVRSQFLGNVSHELRTPIFSMQGFLETLLDGAIDDPKVNRDFLEKAHSHTVRLNTLLNDLIDISRIESGEMKMSFRYFNLREFLEKVVRDFQAAADQRGVRLVLQPASTPDVQVLGDKERLQQVLSNLIENAVKYIKPDGEVVVACNEEDKKVRISVTDTGIGIAEEHQQRVFERFYRVDRDRSREAGGTGLGLAIVKHIVEAHESEVEVRSEVGKGSSFSFTLKT
jgi:two-component system phosphate regulon sensor histidine kinase PhoR